MKNYLIIVASLLTSVMSVQAGHVGEFEASQKALSFMKKNAGTRSAEPNLTRVYLPLETKAAAWSVVDAPLYAFNCEGGGYVSVAVDDRTVEILAFSEKGRVNRNRLVPNRRLNRNWKQLGDKIIHITCIHQNCMWFGRTKMQRFMLLLVVWQRRWHNFSTITAIQMLLW